LCVFLYTPDSGIDTLPKLPYQYTSGISTQMLQDEDANKSERVMEALLQMKKIDIQGLRIAYEGQ